MDLIKNFEWTNEDQNTVSTYIAQDGMAPEDAAAKWVEDNPDKVEAWLQRPEPLLSRGRVGPGAPAHQLTSTSNQRAPGRSGRRKGLTPGRARVILGLSRIVRQVA